MGWGGPGAESPRPPRFAASASYFGPVKVIAASKAPGKGKQRNVPNVSDRAITRRREYSRILSLKCSRCRHAKYRLIVHYGEIP